MLKATSLMPDLFIDPPAFNEVATFIRNRDENFTPVGLIPAPLDEAHQDQPKCLRATLFGTMPVRGVDLAAGVMCWKA